MIVEGRNAVEEALAAGRTIEKVLVRKDVPAALAGTVRECIERRIPVARVERAALDRATGGTTHRGIAAFASDFAYCELDDILAARDERGLLIVMLDSVEDPHNLGAVIRVAECAGASGVVIPSRRCCPVTEAVERVSCGATEHVKIAKVGNMNDAIRYLKKKGVFAYALDMSGADIWETDLSGDVAIVAGGENVGTRRLTRELCDGVIGLRQCGKINSLNVSVATGIAVYECLRQRRAK